MCLIEPIYRFIISVVLFYYNTKVLNLLRQNIWTYYKYELMFKIMDDLIIKCYTIKIKPLNYIKHESCIRLSKSNCSYGYN